MVAWLLAVRVVGGPLSSVVWGLAAVCVLALLARRPTAGWTVRLGLGVVVGALVGVGAVVLVDATDAFGAPVPLPAAVWASAASAAVGLAIAGLGRSSTARSTRWRRAVAVALLVLAPLSAGLGINTFFGIDRTVGALVGVTILPAAESLPARRSDPPPPGPVWESWAPPSGMPAHGEVRQLSGEFAIPSSSGFTPRDAAIYLPPAALVDHPPPLPFAVFMMGMPGNPDPELIRAALDEIAAENSGLAPIVIVADQLGGRYQDPACADSKTFGGVSTYVNEDIPAYARSRLNILPDARHWMVMGFSNGGACAFAWAAEHPELWGNLVDLSGDEFPGAEDPGTAIREVFGGDRAAFEAAKPAAWLARNRGMFSGNVAVFTAGAADAQFTAFAKQNSRLAADAGFDVTFFAVPDADHNASAVSGGLRKAFDVLYPHLGLAPPGE